LIQPRRICRREVEMHVRMRRQKIANHLDLVHQQIVQNDASIKISLARNTYPAGSERD
jgi:hypothetical protein